jgi:hypothetical protein
MNLLKPEYNMLKTAGSRLGIGHTKESNLKNRLVQVKRIKKSY